MKIIGIILLVLLTGDVFPQTVQIGGKKNTDFNFRSEFAFSKSGLYVAAGNTARTDISVYETFSGLEISRIPVKSVLTDLYFLDDRYLLLVSGFNVEIMDFSRREFIASYYSAEYIRESAFCEAKKQLVISHFNSLELLDCNGNEIKKTAEKSIKNPGQITVSENGNLVSLREGDKVVCLTLPELSRKCTVSATNVKAFAAGNTSVMCIFTDPYSYAFYGLDGKQKGEAKKFTIIPENVTPKLISIGSGFIFDTYKRVVFISEEGYQTILKTEDYFTDFQVCRVSGKILTGNADQIKITDSEGNIFCSISKQQIRPFEMFFIPERNKYVFLSDSQVIFKTGDAAERIQSTGPAGIVKGSIAENHLTIDLADGSVQIWDIGEEKLLHTINTGHIPLKNVFDETRELYYWVDFMDSAVYRYDVSTGVKQRILKDKHPVTTLSVVGDKLFTGNMRGDIVASGTNKQGIIQKESSFNLFGNGISFLSAVSDKLMVASYGRMGFLNLNLSDSAHLNLFIGHNGYIRDIAFLNNNKHFISASNDRSIKLWNTGSHRLLQSYDLDSVSAERVLTLSNSEFMFFGSEIVVGAIIDSLTIRNDEKPEGEIIVQSPNSNTSVKLAINKEGNLLAAEDGNTIKIRDLKSGFLITEFTTSSKVVNGMAFSADDKMIVVAAGTAVECFDPLTGKSIRKIDLSKKGYPGILGGEPAFLGRSIHDVECYNNAIIAINNHGWHNPLIIHKNSGLVLGEIYYNPTDSIDQKLLDVKCMPDGKHCVTMGNKYIKVFSDAEKMELKWLIRREGPGLTNPSYIDFMDLDAEGRFLLFVDFDPYSKVKILDLNTGRIIQNNNGGIGAFGVNGKYIHAYGKDRICVRDINSDSMRMLDMKFDSEINNIIYSDKKDIFVISDIWGNIKILEGRSCNILSEISRWDQYTYSAQLSASGKFMLFNNRFGLYTIDFRDLKREAIPGNNYPLSAVFSPDNDKLYYRRDSVFYCKDLLTAQTETIFNARIKNRDYKTMQISSDGKVLYFTTSDDDVYFIDLEQKKIMHQINRFKTPGIDGLVIRDFVNIKGKPFIRGVGIKTYGKKSGLRMVEISADENHAIRNLSQEIIYTREGNGFDEMYFQRDAKVFELSADNKYLVYMADLKLRIADNITGKQLFLRDNPVNGSIQTARISDDLKYFIIGMKDGMMEVYDFEKFHSGREKGNENQELLLLKTFRANAMGIDRLEIKADQILVNGANTFTSIFDIKNNFQKQLDMDFIRDNDQVFINADGYYYATKTAVKYVAFKRGASIYPMDQLDLVYNRPDQVLGGLKHADTNLLNGYHYAYLKRMKKSKNKVILTKENIQIPEAEIMDRTSIPFDVRDAHLDLHIAAKDPETYLGKLNIWINSIPVYGMTGLNLSNKKTHSLDTVISLLLSNGMNRIEFAVENIAGMESFKTPVYVNYSHGNISNRKVHFIGIGLDKFANADYNLNYSGKDIRDLADSMKRRYGDTLQIDTLFNENVSIKNVAALKNKLLKTNINDKVIVAYSGHGLLSKDFDYYLSTYTVDFEHPEKDGLPYEALENLLDSIPARQKLMLIDACHSGEVDKDELVRIKRAADSLGLKGVDVVAYEGNESGLGLQNSFELMQELFVNVGKGTGATIISASGGTQFALEKGDLKNGVFTYSILEAMKNNPTMTVSQLKTIVGKRVVELTNGMQKPTSRNETVDSDWRVW